MIASERKLLKAWGALMGLSLALAVAAETARPARFLLVWTAVVVAVAYFKARIVLADYLGLRSAPGALAGFGAAVAVILLTLFASFALEAAPKLAG